MLENHNTKSAELNGKPFPCPLCKMALPVAISQKQKPYCVCNVCGIQLFFRGKVGIKALQQLLEKETPIKDEIPGATLAVSLYNRLEQFKQDRQKLENKQGIIFRDEDLDNAIAAIDGEIKRLQSDLKKSTKEAEKKK
jgi:hypothetical protein